jgi:hypothetical protein
MNSQSALKKCSKLDLRMPMRLIFQDGGSKSVKSRLYKVIYTTH